MNNIKIFENKEFGQVRTVIINEDPYFVGKDVAEILGYAETANMRKLLEADEYKEINPQSTEYIGFVQNGSPLESNINVKRMLLISESGLYQAIFNSTLPNAKQFKRWVTHEVLPSIRKHGVYAVDALLNDPDTLIKTLEALKKERAEKAKLAEAVQEMKPKALFADAVSASETSILIGDLAKLLKQNGYDTGQKRLFEQLRQEGYLMKESSSRNLPTQMAMEKGLFVVKERTIINPDDSIRVILTTKVTGKGQTYFINKFLGSVA